MTPDPSSDWLRSTMARYQRPLWAYARRLLRSDADAADVVQDTFLRLMGKSPSDLNGSLAPWLYTVCRSRAMDLRRKDKRMTLATDAQLESLNGDISPAGLSEQSDSANHILKLLEQLPANQQEVLRLKFQHGLSYRQIAEVTEHSETNVGFLIHTGLKTIRERMRKTGNMD